MHGDPVLQPEPAVADDGLQKLPNLFGGGDFIGDWHS
jgi:hypothetical protein